MNNKLLKFEEICNIYNIEPSFLKEIYNFEIITFIEEENTLWLEEDMIDKLEKVIRLHKELGVNLEGIDIIINLLEKIEKLEEELLEVKRKLAFFEEL